MKNKTINAILFSLFAALVLVAGLLTACNQAGPSQDEVVTLGTTNFDTIVLSQDLTVGDDLTVTDDAAVGGDLDVTGSVNFGTSDLYSLGYASDGYQLVFGTDSITGTATAAHGLTTVTWALCSLGENPEAGSGDAAYCTTSVITDVVTVKVWQDDFVTAATEADVDVHWLVIGQP